jgi:Prokaryotic N-terminal methylation motif
MTIMPPHISLRAEQGVTLMELLVAMLVATVVLGALLATLEFSLSQETSIADRVSSDRIARLTMGKVIQELQSSCTGFGATAIQAPSSTPSSPLQSLGSANLWFISAFGTTTHEAAVLSNVNEHDVVWKETGTSSNGKKLGSLIDYSFASKEGEAPNWVFPALKVENAKEHVLATNVIPPESGSIFRYYEYESNGSFKEVSGSEAQTAAAKAQIAKVAISFTQAAENGDTKTGRTASASDAIVLRFNNAVSGSESGTSPCA